GHLVVEMGRSGRDLDRSERELLRMFSESVALVVRNAFLHQELSEAKGFLENLIQSAAEAIVAVDPEGRVVVWNPAAARLFGAALGTARGMAAADVLPAAVMTQLEPGLAGPRASRMIGVRLGDGDLLGRELTMTASPLPWGGRGEQGLLVVARD